MDDSLSELLVRARNALQAGSWEEALVHLESTPTESMLDPNFWYLRGLALEGLERFAEAGESFETLCELVPGEIEPRVFAAEAFARVLRFGTAERVLLAGLARQPDSVALLEAYCFVCAQAGQTEKARELLDRLIEIDPRNETSFQIRILIEFVEGKRVGLLEAKQHYLDGVPESAEKSVQRAIALLEAGRVSGAMRWFERATRQDPAIEAELPELREELRFWSSRWLWPNRLFDRFGLSRAWLLGVLIALALQSIDPPTGAVFTIGFLALCLYTWLAPVVLRRFRGPGAEAEDV